MVWTGRRAWTRLGRVPTDVAGLWPAPQCETRRCTPEKQVGGCIVDPVSVVPCRPVRFFCWDAFGSSLDRLCARRAGLRGYACMGQSVKFKFDWLMDFSFLKSGNSSLIHIFNNDE